MNKTKSANYTNKRLQNILTRPSPDYPEPIPFYRGYITEVSLDFDRKEVIAHLFRSKGRIDQYMVVIERDDKFWMWSKAAGKNLIHAELRRLNPPVMSWFRC